MAAHNWRVGQLRSANAIEAYPQRMESADKTRWACGRNVKRALADHRYDAVEVWTLKTRDLAGKVVVVDTHRRRADAELWIAEGR